MAGMQDEFARRWNRKPPHEWHADYSAPGFEVPEDLCRCGHGAHLHDREAVPGLCIACGTAHYCAGGHDHTERCRQCGRDGCCEHCAAVLAEQEAQR